MKVKITVRTKGQEHIIMANEGQSLRDVLLKSKLSPYVSVTQKYNCGGNGLCATCGVWLEDYVNANHWHDKLAKYFSYPRLSCQVKVADQMVVELVDDKQIWGRPDKSKKVVK